MKITTRYLKTQTKDIPNCTSESFRNLVRNRLSSFSRLEAIFFSDELSATLCCPLTDIWLLIEPCLFSWTKLSIADALKDEGLLEIRALL